MSKTWDHAQNAAGTPIDERNCQLFGFVSILTQLLMGVVVLVTLLYKRHQERPRRAWQIWMLDVSKQLTGQLFVHILNVMFSAVGTGQDGINPCSLYFLNILLDTTLGTWLNAHSPPPCLQSTGIAILYVLLRGLLHTCQYVFGWSGFVSGEYSAPMRDGRVASMLECWLRQTTVYVIALVLMKLFVLALMNMLPFLILFGSWLLSLFGTHRSLQVVFVMAIFPMAMNMLQFWIVDSMLLYKPSSTAPPLTGLYEPARQTEPDDVHVTNVSVV